jgi:hypothetical protein
MDGDGGGVDPFSGGSVRLLHGTGWLHTQARTSPASYHQEQSGAGKSLSHESPLLPEWTHRLLIQTGRLRARSVRLKLISFCTAYRSLYKTCRSRPADAVDRVTIMCFS